MKWNSYTYSKVYKKRVNLNLQKASAISRRIPIHFFASNAYNPYWWCLYIRAKENNKKKNALNKRDARKRIRRELKENLINEGSYL